VKTGPTTVEKQRLHLINSSLASQALAPPLSDVEMGCAQRRFPDIGRKLTCRAPLERQKVHWEDSVLAGYARSTPNDLRTGLDTSYFTMVTEAFNEKYWSSEEVGVFGAPAEEGALPYSHFEANFGMFFALAIQLYESTLISDDSPFDRSVIDQGSNPIDLSASAQRGFTSFRTAHCALCHIGPVLTPVAIETNAILVESNPAAFGDLTFEISTTRNVITRTTVSGGPMLVDTGFANTGLLPEAWDPGLGGSDPFGNPLSFAAQYLQLLAGNPAGVVDPYVDEIRPCDFDLSLARNDALPHPIFFTQADGVLPQSQGTENCFRESGAFIPTPLAAAAELANPLNRKMRSADAGAMKIPTLRNVELTGPYMHNGGMATLDEVLEFYTRGGNFDTSSKHFAFVFDQAETRDPAVRADIIEFLKSLTDDRVRFERAPFDHPELWVPHGHVGDHEFTQGGNPLAGDLGEDEFLVVSAVGANGRQQPLQPFHQALSCVDDCDDVVLGGPPPPDPGPVDGLPLICVPEPDDSAAIALLVLMVLWARRASVRVRASQETGRSSSDSAQRRGRCRLSLTAPTPAMTTVSPTIANGESPGRFSASPTTMRSKSPPERV
jgi:cytochrome c peroxidase